MNIIESVKAIFANRPAPSQAAFEAGADTGDWDTDRTRASEQRAPAHASDQGAAPAAEAPLREIMTARSSNPGATDPKDDGRELKTHADIAVAYARLNRNLAKAARMPGLTHAETQARHTFVATQIDPIRRFIFRIQQGGPPAPEITSAEFHHPHAGRAERRAKQLAIVIAAQKESTTPKTSTNWFINGELKKPDSSILPPLRDVQRTGLDYSRFLLENFGLISRRDRAGELRHLITTATDLQQLNAFHGELNFIEGPGAAEACHSLQVQCSNMFQTFSAALSNLIRACIVESKHQKDVASAAEEEFFSQHGLPHESTNVSKRFDRIIAEFEARLKPSTNESSPSRFVPPDPEHLLGWVGITLV